MTSWPGISPHWKTVDTYYSALGLPEDILRWMCVGRDRKTATLDKYTTKIPGCSILEIGTFIGVSAAGMALSNPSCRVCTVDPNYPVTVLTKKWGVESTRGSLDFARVAFRDIGVQDRISILEGYFSCPTSTYWDRYVNDWGGEASIGRRVPSVLTSEVEEHGPFDVIFVDGDHSTQAVHSDLTRAAELLAEDGTMLLDDVVGHCGDAVRAAVQRFKRDQQEQRGDLYSFSIEDEIGVMRRRRS
jgi:predicted O-methyltransferase YrrM